MIKTEKRNPKTTHIDEMTAEEIVAVIQEENKNAVSAIDAELPTIAAVIDAIARRMSLGGRLF